ncbi:MAG TPA: hydrogenase formation protein HypD [Armatimonadota bacterium]
MAQSELRQQIERIARDLTKKAAGQSMRFMEVCGTHSHAVGRYGIRQLLPENVALLSGPGCPVCVTPTGEIDWALELAAREDTVVTTFGDMLRVPGSKENLADLRARGAQVQIVYSPMQALETAAKHPGKQVVFIAVGFETTTPPVAVTVRTAAERGLENFTILASNKLIPPAMKLLLASGEVQLNGFLCPGHVSTIIGMHPYQEIADEFHAPCVIAGFEALDVMKGLYALVAQVAEGRADVENEYSRTVRPEGNPAARAVVDEVFEVADATWRGLGLLPGSGLALRERYAAFDAVKRFNLQPSNAGEHPLCHCGEVLRGVLRSVDCPAFDHACNPEHPLGPCMVSSEGACAAAYRYERPLAGPIPDTGMPEGIGGPPTAEEVAAAEEAGETL